MSTLQGCGQGGPLGSLTQRALWESEADVERTLPPEFFHLWLLPHLPLLFSLSSAAPQLPVALNGAAGQSTRKEVLAIGLFLKEERGRAVITSIVIAAGLMAAHQAENLGGGTPSPTCAFLLILCSTSTALFWGCAPRPPLGPPSSDSPPVGAAARRPRCHLPQPSQPARRGRSH